MLINDGNDRLEIIAIECVPETLPTPGDTRFSVDVTSGGFTGSGWAWIDAECLRAFVADLRALEISRNGAAEVESMSPGQFRLRIWATDRAGHVALAGSLSRAKQSLEFSFSFCPTLLPGLVSEFAAIVKASA